MDENQPFDEELKRFRAEATELLGIDEVATSTSRQVAQFRVVVMRSL
jgi:hypothetical protein